MSILLQESLGVVNQVLDDNSGAKRVDNVLVSRVKDQPGVDGSIEADDTLQLENVAAIGFLILSMVRSFSS